MKVLKSPLLGTCTIAGRTPDDREKELKYILREHRVAVIKTVLRDVPTYIHYKFGTPPTVESVVTVREKLTQLLNERLELTHYEAIAEMVNTRAIIHITNEPFHNEIEAYLRPHVVKPEMKVEH